MEPRTNPHLKRAMSLFNKSKNSNQLMVTNPDLFMQALSMQPDWLSLATAKKLDEIDSLHFTQNKFNIGDLIPFAGHSLGPIFNPAITKIQEVVQLQYQLHEGHFSHPEANVSGNWFDSDRYQPALDAAKQLLGFADDREFIFTSSGLSQNLGMLMETFYRPSKKDWKNGKTKIVMLDTEFFSDQAEAVSVLKRAIRTADDYHCFSGHKVPDAESQILRIKPDQKGVFNSDDLINIIRKNAKSIQMICLSDTVFGTGQRLELHKIFAALQDVIKEHNIIVGLDLAHTVGNRAIDLKSLPVTFAVGCAYKHLSGFAGSSFGIYVNLHADLKKYPPLQGWKAADSNRVFPMINHYDASIMEQVGAVAFRTSNPPPVALASAQEYMLYFNQIGFDKCFNKSECLTRYMIAQLKLHLGDKLELVTPENPAERGAMIVFRVKGLTNVKQIEDFLKNDHRELGQYEIDVRPPNNIRLTAHYGYTKFEHIHRMMQKLALAINHELLLADKKAPCL